MYIFVHHAFDKNLFYGTENFISRWNMSMISSTISAARASMPYITWVMNELLLEDLKMATLSAEPGISLHHHIC